MNLFRASLVAIAIFCVPAGGVLSLGGGTVSGKVTITGTAAKPKPLDLSKEPACVKIHSADPLMPENVVRGGGNALRNVVVYISAAASDDTRASPGPPAIFDQRDCHYTTHVLAVRTGQEIKISNSDPFAHNIHPLAKINREWNKMQLPNTPAFSYAYDKEEIIPIKCNIHPWMQGYFVVLRTSQFAVTGEDGHFSLANLSPGHYVVTADSDRAELLVDYLGLSEKRLVTAAEKMAADGKYELAASLLKASEARYGRTESIVKAERLVYLKLMEKYQNTDPFKFILYSGKIGEQTPQMANGK